jgi:hypothetical protein
MRYYFLLARLYPYWALPLAVVLVQLGIFFRRRKSPIQYACLGEAGLLLLGIVAWFVFRGDLYTDRWLRVIFGD